MHAIDFAVAVGAEMSDHQVAALGEQKKTVVVAGDKRGSTAPEAARQRATTAEDHFSAGNVHHAEVALFVEATEGALEHKRLHVDC